MIVWEVDPNLVRPGWTPLLVVVVLGIALFFLGRSMLRQFGKIDVPADHDPAAAAGPADVTPAGDPDVHEPPAADRRGGPPIPDLRARTPEGGASGAPPDQP
jgi:hypothetical protein